MSAETATARRTVVLGDNCYGKSEIRLATVRRSPDRHDFTDVTVDVRLYGDFAAAYIDGDNADVLPTDTMRGTAYALARQGGVGEIEDFGLRLGRHFLKACPAASRAEIRLSQHPWERVVVDGGLHPHAFMSSSAAGRRTATVTARRDGVEVAAGLRDLKVLKTTRSAFAGFLVDEYTTLQDTADRILATTVTAEWSYASEDVDFATSFAAVRRILLETFAEHDSASVQHTLYAMGEAVLEGVDAVTEIRLTLPNQHHILVDLSPCGLDNDGEVFVVSDRPFGRIEAAVQRA